MKPTWGYKGGGCPGFRFFFRYCLSHLTQGAIFVDGDLTISALEVDEKRKIMKKINFSYFDDIIF